MSPVGSCDTIDAIWICDRRTVVRYWSAERPSEDCRTPVVPTCFTDQWWWQRHLASDQCLSGQALTHYTYIPAGAQLFFFWKAGPVVLNYLWGGSRCQEVLNHMYKSYWRGFPGPGTPLPPLSLSNCATAYELTLPCDWRPLSANDLEIAFKFDNNGVRICPLF